VFRKSDSQVRNFELIRGGLAKNDTWHRDLLHTLHHYISRERLPHDFVPRGPTSIARVSQVRNPIATVEWRSGGLLFPACFQVACVGPALLGKIEVVGETGLKSNTFG